MATGSATHGRYAAIYLDCTSAGTQAVGTANLTLLNARVSWNTDEDQDFVELTAFGDTSKTFAPGLPNAAGDITGNFDFAGSGTLLPNAINASAERALMIFPNITNYNTWYYSGKAFITQKTAGSTTTQVTKDLHFQAGPSGMSWTHP